MHTRAVGRLKLESDLRAAMVKRQFLVFYQPVRQLARWRLVFRGAAALGSSFAGTDFSLPLSRSRRGLWNSDLDRTLADVGGLPATARVADEHVFRAAGEHYREPIRAPACRPRVASDIQNALQQTGIEPSRLQLEMTESVASADPKLTISVSLT
jgi:hypothetical protein